MDLNVIVRFLVAFRSIAPLGKVALGRGVTGPALSDPTQSRPTQSDPTQSSPVQFDRVQLKYGILICGPNPVLRFRK